MGQERVKFIFPVWIAGEELKYWDLYSDKFLNYFFADHFNKYDRIVYFHPSEPTRLIEDPEFLERLGSRADQAGVKLDFVLGNNLEGNHKNVINWWSYWQMGAFYYFENYHYKAQVTGFDKLFVCMSRRARFHKCVLMDELARHRLLEEGYVSWHSRTSADGNKPHYDYPFKYFDGRKMFLDDLYKNITTPWQKEGYSILGNFYHRGFLNIIPETTVDAIPFISEKVAHATLHRKPYLMLGCQGVHKKLKEYGYELYDEVFNYDFDEFPDFRDRISGIIENIVKLRELDLQETYKKLLPKIIHNKKNFLELIQNKENVPVQIFDYEKYLETDEDREKYNFYKKIIHFSLDSKRRGVEV